MITGIFGKKLLGILPPGQPRWNVKMGCSIQFLSPCTEAPWVSSSVKSNTSKHVHKWTHNKHTCDKHTISQTDTHTESYLKGQSDMLSWRHGVSMHQEHMLCDRGLQTEAWPQALTNRYIIPSLVTIQRSVYTSPTSKHTVNHTMKM